VTTFFTHFWPKFAKLCEKNKKMFVELFFWKGSRDAMQIEEGYETYAQPTKTTGASKNQWTEDQENELIMLVEQYSAMSDESKLLL